MRPSALRTREMALCLLLVGGCTHYPDIRGDNAAARAWAESEQKHEEEERNRTRSEQAADEKAIPDQDRAVLPPAPPPPAPARK
ncbi:MAG: hypothetical protein ACHQ53_04480 [Polyangiales bacterium]